ncbi:MAG: hypothetical protein R6U31_04045 [bacterium]
MKYKIALFILIIIILLPFSSRKINYDGHLFNKGAEMIAGAEGNIMDREMSFLGRTVTVRQGTHSMFASYYYLILRHFLKSDRNVHIFNYLLFASLVFPLGFLFARFGRYALSMTVLAMTSPLIILNANNFMIDMPGFVLFIWALFMYLRYRNSYLQYISILLGIAGFMLSYFYGFFLIIVLLDYRSRRRERADGYFALVSVIAFSAAILSLRFLNAGPSLFQALRWTGSETLFNFHKLPHKSIAFLIITGITGLPLLIKKDTYKSPLFYLCVLLSLLLITLINDYPPASLIIYIIFASGGLYTLLSLLQTELHDRAVLLWFAVYSLIVIIFFPMVVSRFMAIAVIFMLIIISRSLNRRIIMTCIIVNIAFSLLFLYSDTVQTNQYYQLKIEDNADVFFTGEWAFRNNIERQGGTMLLIEDSILPDSSILYIPYGCSSQPLSELLVPHLKHVRTDSFMPFHLQVYSPGYRVGYYTNEPGVLPLGFSNEYSVKWSKYLYSRDLNRHYSAFDRQPVIWTYHPVVPVELPFEKTFGSMNNPQVRIEYFPGREVLKSDGVSITVMNGDEVLVSDTLKPVDSYFTVDFQGRYDNIHVIIDTLESFNYDWIGIYVE